MKYLSNIVKKDEVKLFIENNSEKAIDYIKTNFNVNDLYMSVVENIENFTSDDIDIFYDNIKNYATKYTYDFLMNSSKKNLI